MIKNADGSFRYAPRDLIAFLEGDFAAWCERLSLENKAPGRRPSSLPRFAPDMDDDAALAARMGQEHEDRYLARMQADGAPITSIARNDPAGVIKTINAMRGGAPIIYQAHLSVGDWGGYPDFLVRVPTSSALGNYSYEPWDTKLARSAKPYFLVQLCAYAEMLETMQGTRPERIVFVLGNGEQARFVTRDYFHYYLQLRRSFLAFQAAWRADAMPDPGLDRSWGRWQTVADAVFENSDHLSRIAGIARGHIRKLEEHGIRTMGALAGYDGARAPRLQQATFTRLRLQAQLQIASFSSDTPKWAVQMPISDERRRGLALLPPPSSGDVFFDMEGFPYLAEGLEYLFGAVTLDDGARAPAFHDWWAHDAAGERRAFEEFIDWVVDRRRTDPGMHIYHYASYEVSRVRKLMGTYATRENEVDDLLRNEVFVDLYTIVRQGLFVGTPSYSLKDVERLYSPKRDGAVTNAAGSVVEYQRWLDSGEPAAWRESPILAGIRDYNRVDCESTWRLREWLLERQRESRIGYVPGSRQTGEAGAAATAARVSALAQRAADLAARLSGRCAPDAPGDAESKRVAQLVAWLTEFHRREEKPMWWKRFDRDGKTAEELRDDPDCLGGLERTDDPPVVIKRSVGIIYQFDPDQDTRLRLGSKCFVAGTDLACEIHALDTDGGFVELKVSPKVTFPQRLSLIPNEFVSAEPLKEALVQFAESWERGEHPSQAVEDLLHRRAPRVREHVAGPLVWERDTFQADVIDLVTRLQGTTLCIQGPPGTGKTHTAAAIIAALLAAGARVGVAANSHRVIMNLLGAVVNTRLAGARIYKVGGEDEIADDDLVTSGAIAVMDSKEVADLLGGGPVLVGGTAWLFSRPELRSRFDYLFIDEAGQVSLANAVAMGPSATNLILIGDQMQLAQPMQGSHPGESGSSCLTYMLHGHATVPADRGIFLDTSWRMHPDICRFVSEAIYEGRLRSAPSARSHRVLGATPEGTIGVETGVVFVPVAHEDCTQSSDEEVEAIERIVFELLGRGVTGSDNRLRPLLMSDILIVAPFNMQVRKLRARLGHAARVGSVDRFQGQEAAIVIVSLCTSSVEDAPRGPTFLLEPNRLNVAISRARALAIVVGSPDLLTARCRSVEEVKLVNLVCWLEQYAAGLPGSRGAPPAPVAQPVEPEPAVDAGPVVMPTPVTLTPPGGMSVRVEEIGDTIITKHTRRQTQAPRPNRRPKT